MKLPFVSEGTDTIKKGINYLKYNGLGKVISNVRYKMSGPGLAYNSWYKETHEADEEELAAQRNHSFGYEPIISIIVPVYMTPEFYLRSMIESVQAQTYEKWQLCIIDGSQADKVNDEGEPTDTVYERVYSIETEKIVRQYAENDSRIKYKLLETNGGICLNANVALNMADGDYVALMNHDDTITEDALYCVVESLNETIETWDVIYSDEDKMSDDGTKYSDPALKPDFSIDLLRSCNYIEHFFVVRRNIAVACGGFRKGFEGAWNYDFILRCVEGTARIKHIPRVLYHWRMTSRANNARKRAVYNEVAKRTLASHIERCGYYATVVGIERPGLYKVVYETPGNPFISIIIPGCDSVEQMNKCLQPLFEFSRYSNFEIIIIDYDGKNQEMIKFYHRKERERKNIKVVVNNGLKSAGELKNYGASLAKGNYILFLDSSTELIDTTAIGEMLGVCMRRDVAVCGGVLYNDNLSTINAGYFVGIAGGAAPGYRGIKKNEPGYLMYNLVNREVSAVSSSCMLVKSDIFKSLGGFSSDFSSYLADVDFCLKCQEMGYLVVCVAGAGWYLHNPERNLSTELKGEEPLNIRTEENLFRNLWSMVIEEGDPYYNINFSREDANFSLERQAQE